MITTIHLLRQLEIGNPAERNNVFVSYAILQETGRLSVKQLGLQLAKYEPEEHYNAVKATETACAHR
ncbi:MAG: hypothetical protein B7Y12_18615 [Rhizobiales bacterium 24-66-13]|jgi:hypothetical protein|nr:MAG: hypothetical protein B7Y12_18615 [Rhizobiales bacterium 24-66-13]